MSTAPVTKTKASKQGALSLTIKDRNVLYATYMPFMANGGLFVPTEDEYALGDEVFLLLRLMDEPAPIPVAGRVVWITPPGAEHQRVAGIGAQLSDGDDLLRTKIETYLAGTLKSGRPTHTL